MIPLPPDVQQRMNNVAYKFADILRDEVVRVLSKEKNIDSGELRDSIVATIRKATDTEPPALVLRFREYGEYIGKRKLLWTKMPSVQKLAEWVMRKGFADLSKPVPGYKVNKAIRLTPEKRAQRIAFAIAKSKYQQGKFRRIPWKREAFPKVLKDMNSTTITEFGNIIELLFKESLEGLKA